MNTSNQTNSTDNAAPNQQYYTKQEVLQLIQDAKIDENVDIVFLLVCAIFIFLMQMGFAMLEAGTVRIKNSSNILLKNLLDTYVGAIVYYLIGYGLANDAQGGIIGQYHFASTNFDEKDYLKWIIQYSVCSNIPTIVAGSLAERTFVDTYMFFAFLITGFIYPVAAAWVWGGGWLKVMGFKDFAGAGVVHLLGGTCGLVGTVILGPRLGVFGTKINNKDIKKSPNPQKNKQRSPNQHHLDSFDAGPIDFQINEEDSAAPNRQLRSRRRSNSQHNVIPQWIIIQEEKHTSRLTGFCHSQPRKLRRSLSYDDEDLKHDFLGEEPDYPDDETVEKDHEVNLSTLSEMMQNVSNERTQAQIRWPNHLLSSKQWKTQHQQRDEFNRTGFKSRKNHNQIKESFIKPGDFRQKKLSNPNNTHADPSQKARMDKIRKEYPEFEMVDDRQLSQIMYLYDINIKSPIRPSSVALIIQGTFFLWICWLFYNISPSNGITQNKMKNMPSRIVMNTILSSASSCVSVLFFGPLVSWGKQDPTNKYPVQQICNSLLVGLVSITGCCNNVQPWAAIIIGSIGTLIYCLACKLFEKLKIDDPLESSQIHMFCGLWGILAVGLLDMDEGIFFTGNFDIMLKQLIGAFAIMMWATVVSFLYFYLLKRVNKFRVGHIYEITGMDVLMHGGTDLLSNEMINKIEARQRSIANANRLQHEEAKEREETEDVKDLEITEV